MTAFFSSFSSVSDLLLFGVYRLPAIHITDDDLDEACLIQNGLIGPGTLNPGLTTFLLNCDFYSLNTKIVSNFVGSLQNLSLVTLSLVTPGNMARRHFATETDFLIRKGTL